MFLSSLKAATCNKSVNYYKEVNVGILMTPKLVLQPEKAKVFHCSHRVMMHMHIKTTGGNNILSK